MSLGESAKRFPKRPKQRAQPAREDRHIASLAVSDLVITEDREAVRHVVLNRPEKRNAFDGDLVLALGAALRAAADDPSVRCVVLRGNGPVFSAGMDVTALAGAASEPHRLRAFRRGCLEAWNLCEEMTKPVVAQIHGVCLGGALELALACDLRVFASDAWTGLPETRLGLVPDVGGSSRLPQVVGVGRAKELIMTGRVIDAADAERFGLANRVADDVAAATDELVGELLACAPIAVGLAKRLIDASARPALSTTLELEVAAQELCARTEDVREGVQAAAERRAPVFKGR
jgi:enoyl-CoA hydratase/carnithine racemase